MQAALARVQDAPHPGPRVLKDIAASFQYNLARGIARLAIGAAQKSGIRTVALSGGVAYNHSIRETIRAEVAAASLDCVLNTRYPLGDGCVSFGQCVWAGCLLQQKD
jgi:hydrogenase maturation protein HypF